VIVVFFESRQFVVACPSSAKLAGLHNRTGSLQGYPQEAKAKKGRFVLDNVYSRRGDGHKLADFTGKLDRAEELVHRGRLTTNEKATGVVARCFL